MAHLRLVPTSQPPAHPDGKLPPPLTAEQILLSEPDTSHLYDEHGRRRRPAPPAPGEYPPLPPELEPPELSPGLKAKLDEVTDLMAGRSREERVAIARTMYRDANDKLRARCLQVRKLAEHETADQVGGSPTTVGPLRGLGLDELSMPDEQLQEKIGQVSALMAGRSPQERLDIARTMYHDADGKVRARCLELRSVDESDS